ncbi:MAG: family 43 glycosylhydrolase, partial [Opitutaceae bacterium]|nr:family 43 glycosylhydrolase [Opitutaceae bacterium]
PSPSGTFNVVPFYAQLYRLTQHQPYLDAALRAADFAWNNGHARARFTGGTIDNPDVIDKEAATLSLEGYLALHDVTRDPKWLHRAQVAAVIAETWMRIWNIPMPSDATQDQLHWPIGQSTVGMQLVATGHTGDDAYMAWDVASYARLYRETGDPHYLDVARILLHNTKAMVGRPGDNRGTRGPGWQQEHCWLDLPRGKGRHRAWLPWVTVSHLRGINDLIDLDPALYNQLATATAEETAAAAERIAAAARQSVRKPALSPSPEGAATSRRPSASEWKYDRGPDPKTTGSLRVDGKKIILTGDFSKGGKRFVAASCPIAFPPAALATFKVRTDQKKLYVRLVDATGQRHQQEHAIPDGGTNEITVPFLASRGKASWGGADDDRLHLPVQAIEILVSAIVSGATGTVEISDMLFLGKNAVAGAFTNPIAIGADPFITRHGDAYYWCQSENDLGVAICKSDSPASLGERRVVWRAPATGPYSRQIWAPELHFLDGRWYVYVAASDNNNANHRMIVLEAATDDPLGDYTFKAELYTGDNIAGKTQNRWAIDGTILTHRDKRYLIWSGWETGNGNGGQWLYAAPMGNPWTVSGNRVRLCGNADHLWERVGETDDGLGLNEGPQILRHGGRTFLVYSASGSWQPSYKLGLLELVGDDPLNPGAWRKHPKPVFSPTEKTFGIGHGSFTTSPDGTQFWHVYHAKRERANGWARAIFAQPFTWTADGFPDFGTPVASGRPIAMPSRNAASASPAVRLD